MNCAAAGRFERADSSDGAPSFRRFCQDVVDVDDLVAVCLEIESFRRSAHDRARLFPKGCVDVSDHEPLYAFGEMFAERGESILMTGQEDLLDALGVDDTRDCVGDRREMLVTVRLDVSRISRLRELRPAAAPMSTRDGVLEPYFLFSAGWMKWNEPGTVAVDENDHRRGVFGDQREKRSEISVLVHHERLLERKADRNRLPDTQRMTREERDAVCLGQLGLLHERQAFLLDPIEIIGRCGPGGASAGKLATQEDARPVTLVLVGPFGIEVDTHDFRTVRVQASKPCDPGCHFPWRKSHGVHSSFLTVSSRRFTTRTEHGA
jgi:hypothetical protein